MTVEKPPPSYEEITLSDDKPNKNTTKIGKSLQNKDDNIHK